MNLYRLALGGLLAATLSTGGVVTGLAVAEKSADPNRADPPPPVALASGLDLLPSATATDWVEYASTVAVVTVVDEQAGQVDPEDLERGEGTIGRRVVIRLDERLWTRPDAEVPEQVTVGTEGWTWSGDPELRTEFGFAGRPRFEVGQQYLVALTSFPGVPEERLSDCEDDQSIADTKATWGALGEFGSVPVTDRTVGVGEFEGATRSLAETLKAVKESGELGGVNATLRGHLSGRAVSDVVPLLERAAVDATLRTVPATPC